MSDLQTKISDHNTAISQLEAEIKSYQTQIETVGKQADTLKNTLSQLDLTRKKLEANLKLTQNKIDTTNLQIQQLALDIGKKTSNISDDRDIVAQSMVKVYEADSSSLIEILLRQQSISDTFASIDHLAFLQEGVKAHISSLTAAKQNLESNKKQTEAKKAELVVLTNQLKSQAKIIADTTTQQKKLLAETKDTEANYKNILADRMAKKNAFEREVAEYESQLRLAVDPSSIPHSGSGVLHYPLDKVIITQYFGNTPFSTANPQIYNGKGHTGVDFGASIGTPVKAALSGIVVGVANTDTSPGCYSFGKWVMIKHGNGLSTLYAHLSLQNVQIGDSVGTGQVIGYSGNTGYTTGPHLHFGVYATQGVKITLFTTSINCRGATIPLADPKAYLNPLSYL